MHTCTKKANKNTYNKTISIINNIVYNKNTNIIYNKNNYDNDYDNINIEIVSLIG